MRSLEHCQLFMFSLLGWCPYAQQPPVLSDIADMLRFREPLGSRQRFGKVREDWSRFLGTVPKKITQVFNQVNGWTRRVLYRYYVNQMKHNHTELPFSP